MAKSNASKPLLLFLDDLRNPTDCLNYMGNRKNVDVSIYQKEWYIVRTYADLYTGLKPMVCLTSFRLTMIWQISMMKTPVSTPEWIVQSGLWSIVWITIRHVLNL